MLSVIGRGIQLVNSIFGFSASAAVSLACLGAVAAVAQAVAPGAASPVLPAPDVPAELTLWQMIANGGVILWCIFGLSGLTVLLAVYLLATISVAREAPRKFLQEASKRLRRGDHEGARELCETRDALAANVLRAGLRVSGHDRFIVQEAMESEGERGAAALWQRISYLQNIGTIAPLLGLLGTVWGMIQAFGSIALDDAQVKGLRMAESVAQAMITTAAGLALAIPALLVYFYLRGRVLKIIAAVELAALEMLEAMEAEGR